MKRLSDVKRIGFGAMRLTGPGIFGPPADPEEARRVLLRALDLGVDHIDTSDYYGPYVANDLIRETLHPYRPELVLVNKVGAPRRAAGTRRSAPTRSTPPSTTTWAGSASSDSARSTSARSTAGRARWSSSGRCSPISGARA